MPRTSDNYALLQRFAPLAMTTKSVSEFARETLKQLAIRKLQPTPGHYQAIYEEISGQISRWVKARSASQTTEYVVRMNSRHFRRDED